MKKLSLIIFVLLCSKLVSFAQSAEEGMYDWYADQTTKSKSILEKLVSSNNIEAALYLGSILESEGKADEALKIYQKFATNTENESLAKVAEGRAFLINNDRVEGNKSIEKAARSSRNKDLKVLCIAAESYIYGKGKDLNAAVSYLEKAQEVGASKYPRTYMVLGEFYRILNDGGKAVTNYEFAHDYNKTSAAPFYKIAEIYTQAQNKAETLKALEKAIAVDQNFAPAYRLLGEQYFEQNYYQKAKESYDKYASLKPALTIDEKITYANILYVSDDYDKLIPLTEEIIKVDQSKNYLVRLLGYAYLKKKDYQKGLSYMEQFFQKAPADKILTSDYENLGRLQSALGQDSLAIISMSKAILMDSTKTQLYGSLGEMQLKAKRYSEAASNLQKFISTGEGLTTNDYYNLGRAYYYNQNYDKSELAFAKVQEYLKENPIGYLWGFRARKQQDPDAEVDPQGYGKAKDQALELIRVINLTPENQAKYKKDLIDANYYLAYYSFIKNEVDNSKMYCNKVLELDSSNADAAGLLEHLNSN